MHTGKGLFDSFMGKDDDGWCKTYFTTLKSVLTFQTLTPAILGKWAATHKRGFFLNFVPWINLTSNTDNSILSTLGNQNMLCFFKTFWWLTGLSKLYDASQPPNRHARYYKKSTFKCSWKSIASLFCLMVFPLALEWSHNYVVFHVTITDVSNQCFPDFHSISHFPSYSWFWLCTSENGPGQCLKYNL